MKSLSTHREQRGARDFAEEKRYRDIVSFMAQILVRNLDDDVKVKIQERARLHGHSTEQEVREILRNSVLNTSAPKASLGTRLTQRFSSFGLDEEIPELRQQAPRPADFNE